MAKVGVFEAKTHLTALLDRVDAGEEIIITRRGEPIAKLVPARAAPSGESVIQQLRRLRSGISTAGLDAKALRTDGRR